MRDRDAVLAREPIGYERAVARLGVALHAEEGARALRGKGSGHVAQVGSVQDLGRVALHVGRRELAPGALSDTLAVVLGVLQPPQLRRRRQLRMVFVGNARLGERRLEPLRVRPRVLGPAHAAALADVEQDADVRIAQRADEVLCGEAVHADRAQPRDVTTRLPAGWGSSPRAGTKVSS